MSALHARHRPRTLADLRGQSYAVGALGDFAAAPHPTAFLFAGPTGVGKSSAAAALANELGCVVDEQEWGGYYVVPSGQQSIERMRDVYENARKVPMVGSGWKVIVVEEADRASDAVQHFLLTALEELPPRCVYVFTTNDPHKIPQRLRDRMERIDFDGDGATLAADADELIRSIWRDESGVGPAPTMADLPTALDDHGRISFRRVVGALGPILRDRRAMMASTPAPAPAPALVAIVDDDAATPGDDETTPDDPACADCGRYVQHCKCPTTVDDGRGVPGAPSADACPPKPAKPALRPRKPPAWLPACGLASVPIGPMPRIPAESTPESFRLSPTRRGDLIPAATDDALADQLEALDREYLEIGEAAQRIDRARRAIVKEMDRRKKRAR